MGGAGGGGKAVVELCVDVSMGGVSGGGGKAVVELCVDVSKGGAGGGDVCGGADGGEAVVDLWVCEYGWCWWW